MIEPTDPVFVESVTVNVGRSVLTIAFAAGDTGVGAAMLVETGLWTTAVPLTGPRHVVPLNGTLSVVPLSMIEPLPPSVNGQLLFVGSVALPVAVSATLVPLSVPLAVPASVMPPPHVALNVPAIADAVCVAIWNWKFPHDPTSGSADVVDDEVQVPTSDPELDDDDEGLLLDVGVAAAAAALPVEVGEVTVVVC